MEPARMRNGGEKYELDQHYHHRSDGRYHCHQRTENGGEKQELYRHYHHHHRTDDRYHYHYHQRTQNGGEKEELYRHYHHHARTQSGDGGRQK